MSKFVKRFCSLLLTLSIVIGMFATTAAPAFAADNKPVSKKMWMIDLPRGNDPNKQGWGYPALKLMSGWSMAAGSKTSIGAFDSYEGQTVYCIEPGVGRHSGDTLPMKGPDYWKKYPADLNDTIYPDQIQQLIGRILCYGWIGNNSLNWISTNPTAADQLGKMLATQFLIHEVIVGERRADFSKIDARTLGLNNVMDRVQSNHPIRSQIYKHYYDIEAKVKNHTKVPSFDEKEYEMKYDGSKYTVTLTDTNNVVDKFAFKSTSNLSFSVSGNKLTITTPTPPKGTIAVQGDKTTDNKTRAFTVWSDDIINEKTGNVQDVITYGQEIDDPIKTNFRLKVSTGSVKLVKESEDGYVEGVPFHIEGSGINKDVVTGKNGEIQVDGLQAGAKVTITEKNVPGRYIKPDSQTVTILPAQTTTVKFENKLKRGSARFQKIDSETGKEINTKDGIFKIQQWDKNKQQYVDHSTMAYSAAQKAYVTTADLIYTATNDGKFRWVEEKAPTGYVKPSNNMIEFSIVEDGQIYHINSGKVSNKVQKGNISLFKTDDETEKGVPGAVYEIFAAEDIIINGDVKYKKGTVVDTLTTLADRAVKTKDLYLGDYYIKEKTAAPGYVVDKNIYNVSLVYKDQTVSVFTENISVEDKAQKGKISLYKTDKETGKAVPNAIYEVYAAADIIVNGDVKYKKGTLVDTLKTESDKAVVTKDLYLGDYLVKEKTAAPDYVIDKTEYPVSLTYKGQEVTVFIESLDVTDMPQKGKIDLIKTDKETGKKVPGAVYEVFAASDIVVNGDVKHKKGELVDTLTTLADQAVSTKELYLGDYYVKEKTAAPGYVIDNTIYPVSLTYKGQNVTVFTEPLNVSDVPQKGKIELFKTDSETGKGVPNAVYEVIADSDIIVNGDVKYKKGTVVDTLTTLADKPVETKALYLGNYLVKEKTAAPNYTIDKKAYKITLAYRDQSVSIFTEQLNVSDTPQKARFNISKHGEELIGFKKCLTWYGIKHTPQYADTLLDGAVYEIYAYEDVVINGDLKYEKDELIETVVTKDGKPAISKPLYVGHTYLVREIVAPDHYFIGSNEYVVKLEYADQNITVYDESIDSYNERQKVKVRLNKSIEENIYYPNPEAYEDVVFGIYALQDIVDKNGKVILRKNSLVDYFHINESGQGISTADLPFSTAWYVKEIKTANGWVLNETKYPFVFSADNSNIPLHWIDINELHGELENNVVKGYVEFKKLSEHDGRPLIATYGIYRASDDMLIEELTTDLDEWVRSSELPKGAYYLAEITPPDRYHKDEKKYPFFIGKNNLTGVTIQVIVTNEPIIGALKPEYKEGGEIGNGVHIPQTGVTSVITAMAALAGTSAAALGFSVIKERKQRKKK